MAESAGEGRKMPGAVIPCGWKTRKRSDYVFLRYGIQSLYLSSLPHDSIKDSGLRLLPEWQWAAVAGVVVSAPA